MKRHLYILLAITFPLFLTSQSVKVEGTLKVSEMDTINTENHLVVKRSDGTLATRMVASLPPPPPDTTRTLQSDLLLTSTLCNCINLPPAMIVSLLDNGYTIQDLVDFQVSIVDLLAGGLSVADLLAGGVTIDELLAGGVTIAELLDAGQTPKEIYDSDNSLLDSLYGKTYQGGLIAYLNTITGAGLVTAPVDQSTGAEWGCFGDQIGGTSSTIGAGQTNTTLIVGGCTESGIAARLCDELDDWGYDDWFLPSKDELNEFYQNLKLNGYGGFFNEFYWNSTEGDEDVAWWQSFFNGSQNTSFKLNDNISVRAVRAF